MCTLSQHWACFQQTLFQLPEEAFPANYEGIDYSKSLYSAHFWKGTNIPWNDFEMTKSATPCEVANGEAKAG